MALELHFKGAYVSDIQSIIDTGTPEEDADSLYQKYMSLYNEPQSCGNGCCFHDHVERDLFVKDLCKALMEYVVFAHYLYLNYYQDEFP